MIFVLMLVILLACDSRSSRVAKQGSNPLVGQIVHVEGMAENARISGVINSNEFMVYCLNIPSWPARLHQKKVTVTGKLEYTEEFMATRNESGEHTAGTDSGVYVIRNCQIDTQ